MESSSFPGSSEAVKCSETGLSGISNNSVTPCSAPVAEQRSPGAVCSFTLVVASANRAWPQSVGVDADKLRRDYLRPYRDRSPTVCPIAVHRFDFSLPVCFPRHHRQPLQPGDQVDDPKVRVAVSVPMAVLLPTPSPHTSQHVPTVGHTLRCLVGIGRQRQYLPASRHGANVGDSGDPLPEDGGSR